jgi:hypothetical protein
LGRRYPQVSLVGLPERGGAGLVLASDIKAAERAVGSVRTRSGGAICVAPAAANGALMVFVAA